MAVRISNNKILQRSLIKMFWNQGQKMLMLLQAPVIELAGQTSIDDLKSRVPYLLKEEPIKDYLDNLWPKAGSISAVDIAKRIRDKKNYPEIDYWEDYFRAYVRERSAFIAGEILDTQAKVVNSIIDNIVKDAMEEGAGIPEIEKMLRGEMEKQMTIINRYQAERIARTEVIGASNKGAFDSASSMGYDMTKEWLTSGLKGIRPSHLFYESLGAVKMNYEYAPGLKYPGDPNGSPDEIINCRCDFAYNIL